MKGSWRNIRKEVVSVGNSLEKHFGAYPGEVFVKYSCAHLVVSNMLCLFALLFMRSSSNFEENILELDGSIGVGMLLFDVKSRYGFMLQFLTTDLTWLCFAQISQNKYLSSKQFAKVYDIWI